jgi:hypothetical protein
VFTVGQTSCGLRTRGCHNPVVAVEGRATD